MSSNPDPSLIGRQLVPFFLANGSVNEELVNDTEIPFADEYSDDELQQQQINIRRFNKEGNFEFAESVTVNMNQSSQQKNNNNHNNNNNNTRSSSSKTRRQAKKEAKRQQQQQQQANSSSTRSASTGATGKHRNTPQNEVTSLSLSIYLL